MSFRTIQGISCLLPKLFLVTKTHRFIYLSESVLLFDLLLNVLICHEPNFVQVCHMHWTRRDSHWAFCFWSLLLSSRVRINIDYNEANADAWLWYTVLFASDYSIILLIKGGNLSGTNSYQALVQSTFGFPGFLVLSVLQFLYPFIGESFIFDSTLACLLYNSVGDILRFIHDLYRCFSLNKVGDEE